ncbi:MAG TPA: hypothetical protein VG147_04325 [Solirubrobacteraceae bacterium]|nr:hypothetical protein [Solirubrobacteraceae bacterium]
MPDWFVGGAGKRKLLGALTRGEANGKPPPWDKKTLAEAAGVHEKHTVFRHLAVLVEAEVLIEDTDGYRVNKKSDLLEPLEGFLKQLELLPPSKLPRHAEVKNDLQDFRLPQDRATLAGGSIV